MAVAPAIIGPNSEDIALINWPAVSTLAVLSFVNMAATKGFSETCRMVLLIPSSAKADKIEGKV